MGVVKLCAIATPADQMMQDQSQCPGCECCLGVVFSGGAAEIVVPPDAGLVCVEIGQGQCSAEGVLHLTA